MLSKISFTLYPRGTPITTPPSSSSPWSAVVHSEPESDWQERAAEYYQRKFDKLKREPSSLVPLTKPSCVLKREPTPTAALWPDHEPELDWQDVAAEYYQRKYNIELAPKKPKSVNSVKKLITSFCKAMPISRIPTPRFGLPKSRFRSRKADRECDEVPILGPESESGDDPEDDPADEISLFLPSPSLGARS